MKSALAVLAATTASVGCGGGISAPSAKPPVVQTSSPQPPPACNPPNTIIAGVCTAPPPAPSPQPPTPVPPPPVVPTHYQVFDLAPLPGAANAQANAISHGHAVGYSVTNGVARATLIWENGSPQDLGAGYANAVNSLDHPVAAGYVPQPDLTSHATLWDHGVVSDILTPVGYDSSIATGINDSGEVVGVAFFLPESFSSSRL
jgi:hypothetical protein